MLKNENSLFYSLVSERFNRYKEARELFRDHAENEYHKTATIDALIFLDVFNKKTVEIGIELDAAKMKKVKANRMILLSMIETIRLAVRIIMPRPS
ncbi:hypothetical protein EON73_03260 [bacterium]|nr:MAG: hypothetical protein EON73_03260 [bacterium]